VAASDASVCIFGQSGTGKELLARAIHRASPRVQAPFVAVNCGAIPEGLLESELFGHKKGSFTGAVADRRGLFQAAQGGTLFLDEVGDMPLSLQVKLLRALEERKIRPVGTHESHDIDVRVVSATHRKLEERIAAGEFREDLYYRLNVVSLEMPALRERRSDIPALARFFAARYARENGKQITELPVDTLEALIAYDWPGNVRELENAIERAVVLASDRVLEARHLPSSVVPVAPAAPGLKIPGSTMAELERFAILETLKSVGGSTSKAAEMLGISARTIQYRLHEYHQAPRSDVQVVRKDGPSSK
jgi:DNA-binding NtrC family response regulator